MTTRIVHMVLPVLATMIKGATTVIIVLITVMIIVSTGVEVVSQPMYW